MDLKEYFAATEDEASIRYQLHKNTDPYPDIEAALLSSAHIQAYIYKTGMVFPYFPAGDNEKETVTSASLTLHIGPEILYWDEKNNQVYKKQLSTDQTIELRPNSITFLRPKERFNLPDYIAARFNLRIVHVHRGLLLGTGPLLDPGFKGFPMIPVHNLTENTYIVRPGDEFINVEFTKISNTSKPIATDDNILELRYKKNRGKTFDYSFTKYIDKNVPNRRVKSSLSSVIDRARNSVDDVNSFIKKIRNYSFVGLFALLLAIVAIIYAGYTLTVSTTDIIDDARQRIDLCNIANDDIDKISNKLSDLEREITYIKQQVKSKEYEELSDTISQIESDIDSVYEQLNHQNGIK